MRRIDSDDDFAMLIGPDTAGRMLEIGVLDVPSRHPRDATKTKVLRVPQDEEVITTGRTEEEIQAAAERFEKWAGELDPATAEVADVSDYPARRSGKDSTDKVDA